MKKAAKKIVKHIKQDIKEQKHMMEEDKELLRSMSPKKHEQKETKKHEKRERHMSKPKDKMKKVMEEFSEGRLHSSFKNGPKVKSKAQALAIGYSEARKSKKKK